MGGLLRVGIVVWRKTDHSTKADRGYRARKGRNLCSPSSCAMRVTDEPRSPSLGPWLRAFSSTLSCPSWTLFERNDLRQSPVAYGRCQLAQRLAPDRPRRWTLGCSYVVGCAALVGASFSNIASDESPRPIGSISTFFRKCMAASADAWAFCADGRDVSDPIAVCSRPRNTLCVISPTRDALRVINPTNGAFRITSPTGDALRIIIPIHSDLHATRPIRRTLSLVPTQPRASCPTTSHRRCSLWLLFKSCVAMGMLGALVGCDVFCDAGGASRTLACPRDACDGAAFVRCYGTFTTKRIAVPIRTSSFPTRPSTARITPDRTSHRLLATGLCDLSRCPSRPHARRSPSRSSQSSPCPP